MTMTHPQPFWHPPVKASFLPENLAEYVQTIIMTWEPRFIVLHNTVIPTFAEWHTHNGYERMNNLETYYRDILRWSAGPHLFVADDLIWAFTPLSVPGVHSPSWNHEAWGVEVVGDYEKEKLREDVQTNIIITLTALYRKIGQNPTTLKLHHEDPQTTHRDCPGSNLTSRKADIIQAIQARLAA
jgi:hypothetical protein